MLRMNAYDRRDLISLVTQHPSAPNPSRPVPRARFVPHGARYAVVLTLQRQTRVERGTSGAHDLAIRRKLMRTAEVAAADHAACGPCQPRSVTCEHKTRPTGPTRLVWMWCALPGRAPTTGDEPATLVACGRRRAAPRHPGPSTTSRPLLCNSSTLLSSGYTTAARVRACWPAPQPGPGTQPAQLEPFAVPSRYR